MRRFVVAALLVLGGCVSSQAPVGPALTAVTHADFSHDTLALTWQPGFCAAGGGCLTGQPHNHLIGLHGLWASEPHALEAQAVPVQQWWIKGCDIYDHDDAPPKLQPATENALASVVPRLKHPLHVHEYTKHARCFGYDADKFFVTSMILRDRFAVNPKDLGPNGDLVGHLVEMTGGGADYTFECVGNVTLMRQALESAHRGWGVSCVIGVAGAGQEISTRPFQLVTGRRWIGSAFGGARGRTDVPKIVDWYMEGRIDIDSLITHKLKLSEINHGFDLMTRGESIRSVVEY